MKHIYLIFLALMMCCGCADAQQSSDVLRGGAGGTTFITNTIVQPSSNYVYNSAEPLPQPAEFQLPATDTNWLYIIDTTNICLFAVSTNTTSTYANRFNFADSSGNNLQLPATSKFNVSINGGASFNPAKVDFKRITLLNLNETNDNRFGNWLTLNITTPISDGQTVTVTNPDGTVFANILYPFSSSMVSSRYSPAVHVNQLGFHPILPKRFQVGWYQGTNMYEYAFGARSFSVYDMDGGTNIYTGTTYLKPDNGWNGVVKPYLSVQEGDFSSITKQGNYYITVDKVGRSTPFRIDYGYPHSFAVAAATGLYNQRCGTAVGNPFSRWTHAVCHSNLNNYVMTNANHMHWDGVKWAAASVASVYPTSDLSLTNGLSGVKSGATWVNQANRSTMGGWHDAGDYSKYTINIAQTVEELVCAADAFTGAGVIDNLGIPESGDGKSDLLQEAKWGADFLLKIQDSDGGFAFLVYPDDKTYENNAPDVVQRQVLFPKNTSGSALAAGALAMIGSSPSMKLMDFTASTNYIAKATNGFNWVKGQITTHGLTNSYQLPYNYGNIWAHEDECAFMGIACYVATGNTNYMEWVRSNFRTTLTGPTVRHPWGWWYEWESWGCAIRSMAFAEKTGRLTKAQITPYQSMWNDSTNEIHISAQEVLWRSTNCCYNTPFQDNSKASNTVPYFFGLDMIQPIIHDYELQKYYIGTVDTNYLRAVVGAADFDLGSNPANSVRFSGVGQNPYKVTPSQWQRFGASTRLGSPTGVPRGSLVGDPAGNYINLNNNICWPKFNTGGQDVSWPLYDRLFMDAYNVSQDEWTIDRQGKIVGTLAWLDGIADNYVNNTPSISFSASPKVGTPTVATVVLPGIDTGQALIAWETYKGQPIVARQWNWTPTVSGSVFVDCEIKLPSGAIHSISTNITVAP